MQPFVDHTSNLNNGTITDFELSLYFLTSIDENKEIKGNDDIFLYPNPVMYQLELELITNGNGNYQISVIDINGSVVKLIDANFVNGANNLEIDVHSLESGIYVVLVRNESGAILNRANFIKSK